MFDYSEAAPQREDNLIPHGAIATLQLTIRPGGAGEDGLLKRSKDGMCEMLDLELMVVDGDFVRRKFWATEAQLEAIFGWRGGGMASLYTREANRVKLARDAAIMLLPERGTNIYSRTLPSGAGMKPKKPKK